MATSINNKNYIQYGALKDRVPQNVSEKLPENVQNYDVKESTQDTYAGSALDSMTNSKGLKPWQKILSIAGSAAVVFGLSALLRHSVKTNGIFKASDKLDDLYDSIKKTKFGNGCKKVKGWFTKNVTDKIKDTSFGKLFGKNSKGVRANMIQPENSMPKMMARGSKGEACDEITDALEAMLKGGSGETKGIKGIFSSLRKKVLGLGEKIGYVKKGGTRFEGEAGLIDLIKKSGVTDDKEVTRLVDLVKSYTKDTGNMDLKFQVKDEFMKVFKNYFGINKTGKMYDVMKGAVNTDLYQRVNPMGLTHEVDMLNAVKNMMILDNQAARTPLGQTFQKTLLKLVEGPTNGVMSRSKIGLLMGLMIYFGTFNKIQKAPKGEKKAVAGNETTTDVASYMMIPVNAGALYGLASLRNLGIDGKAYADAVKNFNTQYAGATTKAAKKAVVDQFKQFKKTTFSQGTWWQKILRFPGKILSFGLQKGPGNTVANKLKGISGGALRLATFILVISPILAKPISKLASKIFGKTSEMKKEEAEKLAKKEAKKAAKEARKNGGNTSENASGMTQEEFLTKLNEHPKLIEQINSDPEFADMLSKNPEMLIALLNTPEEELTNQQGQKEQGKDNIQSESTVANETNITNNETIDDPNRSYVPLSKPFYLTSSNSSSQSTNTISAPTGRLSQEKQKSIEVATKNADLAEEEALKLLGK